MGAKELSATGSLGDDDVDHVRSSTYPCHATETVVLVMGAGHCGSTLLDLLLGSHSQCFSLGELRALDSRGPICGICGDGCHFWDGKVSRAYLDRHFFWRGGSTGRLRHRVAPFLGSLYRHLFEASGARVLIDSSKTRGWICRQLRPFYFWRSVRGFLIYMVRDGRAVTNSYLRKYPEEGIERWAREWALRTASMNEYFDGFSQENRMLVQYEELATNPRGIVMALCRRLGIEYEPSMLRYWTHDHHPVEGNIGTRSLIFRWRAAFDDNRLDQLLVEPGSAEYHRQVGLAIKLDQRWRIELTPEQLRAFDSIAGNLNEPYAYDAVAEETS